MDEWMAECREIAAEVVEHLTSSGQWPCPLLEDEPEDPTTKITLVELERLRAESGATLRPHEEAAPAKAA